MAMSVGVFPCVGVLLTAWQWRQKQVGRENVLNWTWQKGWGRSQQGSHPLPWLWDQRRLSGGGHTFTLLFTMSCIHSFITEPLLCQTQG